MTATNEVNRGRRHVDVVSFPVLDPPDRVDVLVVGAGPSGLATAVDLDLHGVSVAVVDAATEAPLVRAGAMGHTARVVELFRRWHVLQRVREEWTVPPEWNTGNLLLTSLAGHELGGGKRRFDLAPTNQYSTEAPIRRPQTVLQKVFLERLDLRGVSVSGGWRAIALDQDDLGVTTTLSATSDGPTRSIRSRYVVAADGSRSTVRGLAGIEREGEYATERFFRFVVRTRPHAHPAGRAFSTGTNVIVNARYSGFLAALNETDWRSYAGPYPLDVVPSDDELLALARAAFGFDLPLEVMSVTPYFKSTRIATSFRRGRVFLVGDAAHVRTPGGNLGEGFGDVANLGWKLAGAIRGVAGETLLDSYDAERRPHNWRVADHALERGQASSARVEEIRAGGIPADTDGSPAALTRRAEIAELLGRDARPSLGVTFDERYDASPVVAYDGDQHNTDAPWDPHRYDSVGRPGHRAPNGQLDPWGTTLYDRIRSDAVLLVLTAEPDDRSAPSVRFDRAAAERGIDLDVVHLADPAAHERYERDYALVRPDFHVAWRADASVAADPAFDPGAVLDLVYGRGDVVHHNHTTSPYRPAVLAGASSER